MVLSDLMVRRGRGCKGRWSRSRYLGLLLLVAFFCGPTPGIAQCNDCPDPPNSERAELDRLYNDTNGTGWGDGTNWETDELLELRYGVFLDEIDGCVRFLDFDGNPGLQTSCNCLSINADNNPGNGLTGNWPSSFKLCRLEQLSVANNGISGSLPNFSTMPRLEQVTLSDNFFSGPLSPELFNNPRLEKLSLTDNLLTGGLTLEFFNNCRALDQLVLQGNYLSDPLPDLSSILSPLSLLNLTNNAFTFEDFLLNYEVNRNLILEASIGLQRPIYTDTTIMVGIGLPFVLDLMVDDTVTTSRYGWEKDGVFLTEETVNKLTFPAFLAQDSGAYICRVANDLIQNMALITDTITLVSCQPGRREINVTICAGDSLEVLPGRFAKGDTIFVLPERAANGCDSALIISAATLPATINTIDTIICPGEVLEIDGRSFSESTDTEFPASLPNAFGCDSILRVRVRVADVATFGVAGTAEDFILCGDALSLAVNEPEGILGTWRLPAGVDLTPGNNADVIADGFSPGDSRLVYRLAAGSCPAFDSVVFNVYYEDPTLALPDTLPVIIDDLSTLEIRAKDSITANDVGLLELPLGYQAILIDTPTIGTATLSVGGEFLYLREPCLRDTFSLRYQVGSDFCPAAISTVTIIIRARAYDGDIPPNAISPGNGDGKNDYLIIPALKNNPGLFPNHVITISSKEQGQIIILRNYDQKWEGFDRSGRPLPAGDYRLHVHYGEGRADYFGLLVIVRR